MKLSTEVVLGWVRDQQNVDEEEDKVAEPLMNSIY